MFPIPYRNAAGYKAYSHTETGVGNIMFCIMFIANYTAFTSCTILQIYSSMSNTKFMVVITN